MPTDFRVARRSTALMRALSTDFLLREQFVTDPATMFNDYVGGKPLSTEDANATNHLVYAVVSDPPALEWLQSLAQQPDGDLSDAALARGLVVAASKSSDDAVVSALVKFGSSTKTSITPALAVLRGIALGLGGLERRGGTEFTPGTGTNVSPGTGTNVSPGTGTNVSPAGRIAAGTEATPGTGTNVSPGTGTNVSPGTGTNVSPGTGTNVSLGGLLGRFGDFRVTLESLVEFATQLRRVGALSETGFH